MTAAGALLGMVIGVFISLVAFVVSISLFEPEQHTERMAAWLGLTFLATLAAMAYVAW